MDPKFCKEAMSNITKKCRPKSDFDQASLRNIATEIDWEKIGLESLVPSIGDLMVSPSYYMMYVMHSMEKYMRKQLDDFDLTKTQLSLLASLMILTKKDKIVTQMDLANSLKADKMMVSEVLRTLERKGYIIRQNHPSDGRAKSLVVTEKGLAILEVAVKHAVKCNEEFFSPLGDDREEFVRMLKKLM